MQIEKEQFDNYCASIVGHEGNFYRDLNAMAEVVEKLIGQRLTKDEDNYHKTVRRFAVCYSDITTHYSLKKAFRDFIISTMEKEQ